MRNVVDTLNNGAEEIFLSGTYSGQDVQDAVNALPEPSTGLLIALALIVAGKRSRRHA